MLGPMAPAVRSWRGLKAAAGVRQLQAVVELLQRFDTRQIGTRVGTRDVEEHGLHAGAGSSDIIHGIDVANVKAFARVGAELIECGTKDGRMRFLESDVPGIGE